jgi:Xaa-Pro aminopeptidase
VSTARLAKLRTAMAERQVDGLLVCKPENRAYLSGFTGSSGWLLVSADRAVLVTDFRYVEQATAQAQAYEVVRQGQVHFPTIAEIVGQMGATRLGFEGDFITADEFRQYEQLLPDLDLVPVTGMVEGLRMFKDEGEIAIMAKAAAIADEAWSHILGHIRPGVTEWDVAVELEYSMRKLGAQGPAFDTIVASGVRSSLPHGRASQKVIAAGDLVTCDFGALYEGYCSDMTRTVMVGEPTEKQREIYAIVLEAQLRGVAACKAGMTGMDLDEVCRSYIRERGYGENFGHGTGHGVGRFIHEGPKVSVKGANDVLQAGMVVTIEPGIYVAGWGGVRIEDMLLVTETGCRRLSQSPKELVIL